MNESVKLLLRLERFIQNWHRREFRSAAPRSLTRTALLKVCDALSQKLNWFVTFPSFLPFGAAPPVLGCTFSLASSPSAGVAWCEKSVHALHSENVC